MRQGGPLSLNRKGLGRGEAVVGVGERLTDQSLGTRLAGAEAGEVLQAEGRVVPGGRTRRRGRDGWGRRLDLAGRLGQTSVNPLAGLFEQAGGALLALANPLGQFFGGAVLAAADALGDPGHLVADIVDGLGRPALGGGDLLAQTLGDLGDLAAQPFQRLGVQRV